MNAADKLLARAFSELKGAAGETVTFRDNQVEAVVNRIAATDSQDKRRNYQSLDTRATSRIEIALTELEDLNLSRPITGEIIEDSRGVFHRIKLVRHAGLAWMLDCEVTET